MFETLIVFFVLLVLLSGLVKLCTGFLEAFDRPDKAGEEELLPVDKTAEELHEEIMQVAAKDLGCSVEELKELLKDELQEQRRQQRGKPDLHIVK